MKKPFLMVGLALSMAACSQVGSVGTGPDTQIPQALPKVMGTLEVSMVASEDQTTAQARFFPNASVLSAQARDLQNSEFFPITRKFATVLEDFDNTRRYLTTVFDVTNNFTVDNVNGANFARIEFVQYTDPEASPPSVAGTPYHNIFAANGNSLNTTETARSIVPTDKKRLSRQGMIEDDPFFRSVSTLNKRQRQDIQEVANTTFGGTRFPLPVTENAFPDPSERQQVLYQAFTAQNYDIAKGNRFDFKDKGFVGFSYSYPRVAPSAANTPYTFVVRYLVITTDVPLTP